MLCLDCPCDTYDVVLSRQVGVDSVVAGDKRLLVTHWASESDRLMLVAFGARADGVELVTTEILDVETREAHGPGGFDYPVHEALLTLRWFEFVC